MVSKSDPFAVLDGIPPEQIPAAIARLAARQMSAPITGASEAPVSNDILTAEEAAKLLKVDRRYVYAHRRELGGTRLGERKLRFSRRAWTLRN